MAPAPRLSRLANPVEPETGDTSQQTRALDFSTMRGSAIFLHHCVLARDAGCDDFTGAHQWQLRTRFNYAFGFLQVVFCKTLFLEFGSVAMFFPLFAIKACTRAIITTIESGKSDYVSRGTGRRVANLATVTCGAKAPPCSSDDDRFELTPPRREHRRGRVGVLRPQLGKICQALRVRCRAGLRDVPVRPRSVPANQIREAIAYVLSVARRIANTTKRGTECA